MYRKEFRKIIRNYITIILTAVLLLFFVGNDTIEMMGWAFAADEENLSSGDDSGEPVVEDVVLYTAGDDELGDAGDTDDEGSEVLDDDETPTEDTPEAGENGKSGESGEPGEGGESGEGDEPGDGSETGDESEDEDKCEHVDEDEDGICDLCSKEMSAAEEEQCEHIDEDGDGICDLCSKEMPEEQCEHIDEDGDGICDLCKKKMPEEEEPECICDVLCIPGHINGACEVCAAAEASQLESVCVGIDNRSVAYIKYSLDGEEHTAKYLSLLEAIDGAYSIKAEVNKENPDFSPVIVLSQSVTVRDSITVSGDKAVGFALDLAGKGITCEENVVIDFGACDVDILDSNADAISFDGTTDNHKPGFVVGNASTLFRGSGQLTLSTGYYLNNAGVIAGGFGSLTCKEIFGLCSGYNFTSNVSRLRFTSGFYQYKSLYAQDDNTSFVIPDGTTLGEYTILIDGYETVGRGIKNANFRVVREQLGADSQSNPEYFVATFEDAFDKAVSISADTGDVVSVELISDKYTTVAIHKCYSIKAGEDAKVRIKNMQFSRISSSGSPYVGQFFDVSSGQLILQNCSLDGYIEDELFSSGSLVSVASEAVLSLVGGDEQGTKVTRNASQGISNVEPCAAIYAKDGAIIRLSGYVVVNNNVAVEVNSETHEISKTPCDIFMESSASLEIDGPIKTTEEKYIGITSRNVSTEENTIVGRLTESYVSRIETDGSREVNLNAFFMDNVPSKELKYDFSGNVLYWEKASAELAPAGIMRLEYIILLLGLIGFILGNVPRIKENPAAVHYLTVASMVFLLSGAGLGFYHLYNERLVIERNESVVSNLKKAAKANSAMFESEDVELVEDDVESVEAKIENFVPNDGRVYIGIIEIDQLGIQLPVLANYTDADMKTTPCVYYGSRENNNLIIVGHNYDSQFGKFNSVLESDKLNVRLTMTDGTVYEYESVGLEALNPNQVDEMVKGDWDLSLYTCSYSGAKRVTIRCKLVR